MTGSFSTFINAIDKVSANRDTDENFVPDLIVINHGTNDAGASITVFRNALKAAIEHLQEKYPGVTIIYMIPFNQTHAKDIRAIVPDYENCYVVETAGWGLSFTDGVHPDTNGAALAGVKLAQAVTDIKGGDFFK